MADNGFQGYTSGGRSRGPSRSYNSPDSAIETGTGRFFVDKVADGDISKLRDMSLEEFTEKAMAAKDELFQFAQDTTEVREKINNQFNKLIKDASSLQEAMKKIVLFTSKVTFNNVDKMKSWQKATKSDQQNRGSVGRINMSPLMQSIHIQQKILDKLNDMSAVMYDTNSDINRGQMQEETLFDTLRQTVVHSIFNSPTAKKVGGLLSSLMSAGLFKIASNENNPELARKAAMLGVHFQVPETIVNAIGAILQQTVSLMLANKFLPSLTNLFKGFALNIGGKIGGLISNVGGIIAKLGGMLSTLGVLAVALGAVIAGVAVIKKGSNIIKNKVAEVDARTDLDENQKNRRKAGWLIGGGTAVGAVGGASIGAGAGLGAAVIAAMASGAGTGAISTSWSGPGAAIGAGIGALVGAVVGFIAWYKSKKNNNTNKPKKNQEFSQVEESVTTGTTTLESYLISIDDTVKQILQAVTTGAGFGLGLMGGSVVSLFDKIKNSSWWQGHVGAGGEKGGSSSSDAYKKYADNSTKNMWNRRAKPLENSEYEDMRTLKEKYGLKGTIAKDNSVPWTKKENVGAMLQLDSLLNQWGYDVVYTSNMGGKHAGGENSHGSGNKVDLQLFRNGQAVHLTPQELSHLQKLGYHGGSTGALGWEPVKGQTGGGHYDESVKASYVTIDKSNKAVNDAVSRYENDQLEAKRKKEEQDLMAKAMKDSEKDLTQKLLNPASTLIQPKPSIMSKDITGTDDFTRLNTTGALSMRGSY